MNAPKIIYLDLSNIPPCNFGALWYDYPVSGGVAYRLNSDVNDEITIKDRIIQELKDKLKEYTSDEL